MEPLSIAASSAALVTLCAKISGSLYKLICDSREVDKALKAFRDEIDDLSGILTSIESSFRDSRTATAALCETTGYEQSHWEKAERGMKDCHGTLERLLSVLEQVRGDHGNGHGFFSRQRKQIRLNMNSTQIVALRHQIQSYKDTMKLSFHVITISLILNGQNSNANIVSMLDGLTREVRDLQRNWRSRTPPLPSSHRSVDSSALVMENLEDYLNSARSLFITASVLSTASDSVRGKSQDNSDIVEWIDDVQSEPTGSPSAIVSTSSRSNLDIDPQSRSETSDRDSSLHKDVPDSPNMEQYHAYLLPRTRILQNSQIQLPPEVAMFIDECEKVEYLWCEGDGQEASRLGIAFLKTLVHKDVSPQDWENIEKNILHSNGQGLASSGYGFTVLHLLALNDMGQYIKLLLGKGADINALDRDHCTPLHLSSWSGHYTMTKLLIENNALINAKTKDRRTPLHFACQEGRDQTAKLLIRNGADLEAIDRDQRTPLCYASSKGQLETAILLIEAGAHLEVKTTTQLSPLHYACGIGHLETTQLLINKGANVEVPSQNNRTPLHIACLNGHDAVVELLLKHRARIDARDREQRTPLCCASWNNHHSVAELLLSKQSPQACRRSIEARMVDNATSLHISCQNGHLETAKLLIERGADLKTKDKHGWTPLYLACRYGHYEVATLLIEHKADLETPSKDQRTPLHVASEHNHAHIATLLLEHGGYIEAKSDDQGTPLYAACRRGHENTVQMLIKKGANVNAKALKNYTPLHIACRYGHKSVAQLLLDQGANIEEKEKKQRTPLRIACEYGHEDTVRMLLTRGANIEAKSEFNYTPLHSACWSGYVGTVQLLVNSGANKMAKTIDHETPKSIAKKRNAGSPAVVEQLVKVLEGKAEW